MDFRSGERTAVIASIDDVGGIQFSGAFYGIEQLSEVVGRFGEPPRGNRLGLRGWRCRPIDRAARRRRSGTDDENSHPAASRGERRPMPARENRVCLRAEFRKFSPSLRSG